MRESFYQSLSARRGDDAGTEFRYFPQLACSREWRVGNGPIPILIKGRQTMKSFIADEMGLETVEYGIIVGLIVAGLVAVIAAIGTWVKTQFDDLKTDLGA